MIIAGKFKGIEAVLEKINLPEKSVDVIISKSKEKLRLTFKEVCKFNKQ